MTTVIGGDIALAKSGLAVWRDGEVTLRTIKTSPKDEKPKRWGQIVEEVCVKEVRAHTLCVVEGIYYLGGKGAVSLDLAAARAVLLFNLYARGVALAQMMPVNAKILATGNGDANKREMTTACREVLGLSPKTPDEADAAWLMAGGLTRIPEGRAWLAERGVPTERPWQQGIRWPELHWLGLEEERDERGEGTDGLETAS